MTTGFLFDFKDPLLKIGLLQAVNERDVVRGQEPLHVLFANAQILKSLCPCSKRGGNLP